ncbi:Protein FecR [compost metagenome]
MPDRQIPDPTLPPRPGTGLRGDPVWEQALDWLLRIQAQPHDRALHQALANWLAERDEHEQAWRKAEKVWHLSGQLPAPTPANLTPATPTRPRRRWRRALASAAVAACVTLLTLPDWTGIAADHASPRGEHRTITLEDGSRIELDSGSAVDVRFSAGRREVTLLRGQAFFQVNRDPARPFDVRAGDVQVTVTGTAFDISLAPRQVAVAVQSGSVQVEDLRQSGQPAALSPGERIRFARDAVAAVRDRLPPDQIAAWRDWRLLVNDRPLAEVVDELRRYQLGLILLDDPRLAERRLTAALDLRAPRKALQVALDPLGGKLDSWGPFLLVISAR